jgi:hypothetical protein
MEVVLWIRGIVATQTAVAKALGEDHLVTCVESGAKCVRTSNAGLGNRHLTRLVSYCWILRRGGMV